MAYYKQNSFIRYRYTFAIQLTYELTPNKKGLSLMYKYKLLDYVEKYL
jgi:hypothetical protein